MRKPPSSPNPLQYISDLFNIFTTKILIQPRNDSIQIFLYMLTKHKILNHTNSI